MPHPAGPHGEALGRSGGRRDEEEQGPGPLSWFSREGERTTQDRQVASVSVNDLTALWGAGTTHRRLVPGVVGGEGDSGPACVGHKATRPQVWALDCWVCI